MMKLHLANVSFYTASVILIFCLLFSIKDNILYHRNYEEGEVPLLCNTNIIVDNSNNIYCAMQKFQCVQVYSKDGIYLYKFKINAFGGMFKIRFSKNGNIEVATARHDKLYLFARNGQLIKEEQVFNIWYNFAVDNVSSSNSIKYESVDSVFFPTKIIAIFPNNKVLTIVNTNFFEWLFYDNIFILNLIILIVMLFLLKRRLNMILLKKNKVKNGTGT